MVNNWAELKFGKRLKKLAKQARDRVRQKHPELEGEILTRERKEWVWNTLTDAGYSKLAFTVGAFLGLCIALSTVAFVLETVPQYEQAPGWGDYFFYAECFFVVVFTIEIALKFWSTPQTTLEFFKDFLNVIDILAILPFYVELFLVLFVGGKVMMWDLRALRAFRLMRMMKMGRFSGELQLLAEGLVRARVSIAMLCGTLILGTVIFSVLMWVTERGTWNASKQCYARIGEPFYNGCSPFQSVPFGFWWAMTTMTTVGYGDTFPITNWGKVIGGFAMLAGIFCVALPTGILCTEFSKLYEERHRGRKETSISHELQMRPKAQLELFLDGEKIHTLRHDLDEQLIYLKRLAHCYVEVGNKAGSKKVKRLKLIDPMYSTFQNQAAENLDSMRSLVTEVCDELGSVKMYASAVTDRRRSSSTNPTPRTPDSSV
jgi:hypothetical protein